MAKVLEIKKQTNNKFLNMYDARFLNEKTGKEFNYFIASRKDEEDLVCKTKNHNSCDAVMMITRFANGDFVMIKQFRPAINDYVYEFPAGLIDEGETIEEACIREIYEETGLSVNSQRTLVKPSYTSAGMSDESLAIQEVEVCGDFSTENAEANEDIEVIILKQNDIEKFLKENIVAIKASLYLKMISVKI